MPTYAVIDGSGKVGRVVVSESLEAAKEFFLSQFDVTDVVDPTAVEGGDKVAIGCEWDGEKILPLPGTELDELYPTVWEPTEEETPA